MSDNKSKLPPESDDHIIEVSLRHVIFTFGSLTIGTLAVGAGIVFARDYAKYKRQKALIEAAITLVNNFIDGGQPTLWKEKKMDSLSTTMISEKPKK